MPTKPKLQFSFASLLWLMVCVAMFFGGRYSVLQGESLEETLNAKALAKAARDALEDYKRRRTVVRVLKGNRVFIVENDVLIEVRVGNIYCPSPERPFGQKAIDFTTNFCLREHVKLPDDGLDGFGRRWTDIVVDGCSLSEELVNAGLAWQAFEYSDSRLAKIQREAKALKRGLWAEVDTARGSGESKSSGFDNWCSSRIGSEIYARRDRIELQRCPSFRIAFDDPRPST